MALALLALLAAGCAKHRPTVWNRAELEALRSPECADAACLTTGTCTRAHYQRVVHTLEGKPLIDDYFRLPSGSSCEFIHYSDRSADDGGRCEVTQETCRGMTPGEHGKLDGLDCTPMTTVYTAPDCH
ncbi:MAG: hypothetical protein QM723_28070 [Myxococcaceae bacterium]